MNTTIVQAQLRATTRFVQFDSSRLVTARLPDSDPYTILDYKTLTSRQFQKFNCCENKAKWY